LFDGTSSSVSLLHLVVAHATSGNRKVLQVKQVNWIRELVQPCLVVPDLPVLHADALRFVVHVHRRLVLPQQVQRPPHLLQVRHVVRVQRRGVSGTTCICKQRLNKDITSQVRVGLGRCSVIARLSGLRVETRRMQATGKLRSTSVLCSTHTLCSTCTAPRRGGLEQLQALLDLPLLPADERLDVDGVLAHSVELRQHRLDQRQTVPRVRSNAGARGGLGRSVYQLRRRR
jgi:hypothetical protein